MNAKTEGRTVWDLFCTGALEVGRKCLVWSSHKKGTRQGDGCSRTDCTISCAAKQCLRSTLAQPHAVTHSSLKRARNEHAQCDTKLNTHVAQPSLLKNVFKDTLCPCRRCADMHGHNSPLPLCLRRRFLFPLVTSCGSESSLPCRSPWRGLLWTRTCRTLRHSTTTRGRTGLVGAWLVCCVLVALRLRTLLLRPSPLSFRCLRVQRRLAQRAATMRPSSRAASQKPAALPLMKRATTPKTLPCLLWGLQSKLQFLILLPALISQFRAQMIPNGDGFSTTNFPADFDGFPMCRSFKHSDGSLLDRLLEKRFMNSSSDSADTAFSRTFRLDEKCEGLRQSDSRVQKMPASVSSSELSAHQMGEPLAGPSGNEGLMVTLPVLSHFRTVLYCVFPWYALQKRSRTKVTGPSREEMNLRYQRRVHVRRHKLVISVQLVSGTDYSTSPIPITVVESSVNDDLRYVQGPQGGARKRRRYTGKAMKSSSQEVMSIIKSEPLDLAEAAVPGSSCTVLDSYSRVAEVLVPSSPLHAADRALVQEVGITN